MIVIERTVDISKPIQTETLRGNEFKLEANAHTFRISVANNGAAVALTGSVSASMLLADGSGLTLGGSLDNGVAVLTLPQAAYGVPGRFMLAIYSVQTGATEAETVKTCIYACVGAVVNTYGEQQYDPGNLIPDAETLAAYIEACQTATAAANTAAGRAETAALTAVTYAEQTGKTDAEKAQARTNIGAASDADVSSLKSATSANEDDVYRLATIANIDEPYERSGTATSGSTAWAAVVTARGIKLKAGEAYTISASIETAISSQIYAYLADSQGTTIAHSDILANQTSGATTFISSNDYDDAYLFFRTGITTGVTITQGIRANVVVPAIEILKNNAIQNLLTIPMKNDSQSAITNYRAYYFTIKAETTLHVKTKNGTFMNLLGTYSNGSTGILGGVTGADKTIVLSEDLKYLGYYLPAGFDDVLFIYGDVYLGKREELEQIKNRVEVKNGTFSINGYVKDDGSFSSDSNAKRTDYIEIEAYDHVFVDTIIGSAGCSIAFYDGNKSFLSDGSETGTKRNFTKVIPESAKYVIFSAYSFPSATAYLYVDGSVSRKQILDEQDIAELQKWSRKIFDTDALGTFAKFGVCGDSLSVGYMDDSGGTAHGRNIYYSWGQVLARRYGNVCLNFGFSGCTTKTWYTNATHGKVELIAPENLCQCYLVGLGANDSVNDSNVGTASDINLSDYTQNADTFYGNYGKVLQLILDTAQHGYVFAFTLPTLSYATGIKNNAIRGVIETINSNRLFLVDLEQDYKYLFTSNFIADNVVGAHYSAIGYANIATAISIAVTDVMNKNNTDFIDLAFAPYGSNDVIN